MVSWSTRSLPRIAAALLLLTAWRVAPGAEPKDDKKKPDKYDELVDDFILWDIGQLRNEKGNRAAQMFGQLGGDDAVPAVVRGCNKSARIQASCPIMVVSAKLQTLMQNTRDVDTLKYVINNLDRPNQNLVYGEYLDSLRQAAEARLKQLGGSKGRTTLLQGGGTASQLKRSRLAIEEWSLEDLRTALVEDRATDLVRALEEIKKRPGAEYTDLLAKAVDDLDGEMKLIARGLLAQRLVRMTETTLETKLKDRNAEVRAAAALAVGYKEAGLHYELAEALADANPLVSTNAHVSIVKLLGEDFGPNDGASVTERFEASRRWKRWLDARKTN